MSPATPGARAREWVGQLRPGSHDLATEDGRSSERYRRAALTTVVSAVARALALVTLFVSIRVISNTTSAEELGLWLLLITAVTLVGFADFGIGNGLLNAIADARGRDDEDFTREAVSSAFFSLLGLALLLGLAFGLAYPHVDWAALYNVTGSTADQAGPATVAFVVCILAALPLGISQRVHHAHQRGWVANGWQGVGSVISLVAVVVASINDAGTPTLVAAMLAGPPIAYLLDSCNLFLRRRPDLRPRIRLASIRAGRRVISHGFLFFIIATVGAVSYELDTLVISHFLGADQVQVYAVPFRLFMLAPSLVMLLISPLWPAYGEAASRRDLDWVHSTLRRSLALGLGLTLIPSLLLIPLTQPILDVWVRGTVHPPLGLLLAMATWAVLSGISTAIAIFFNGTGVLKVQVPVAIAMGAANLVLSIILVQHIGVAGPMWATVVTQIVVGMVPAWFITRGLFRRRSDPDAMSRWLDRWSSQPPAVAAAGVVD